MHKSTLITLGIVALVIIGAWLFFRGQVYPTTPATPTERERASEESGDSDEIFVTNGVKHSVPLDEIIGGGPGKDGIPPIDSPKFVNTTEAEAFLKPDGIGIALIVNDDARFYSFQIIVWHEIVNDTVGGTPVSVTYCPLCATGIVFDRRVDGEETTFGTSGKLWNSNLVMYDRATDSLWSQVTARAIQGPKTGKKLSIISSDLMPFRVFRERYPDGKVLSTDTGARRDYTTDPYADFYTSSRISFPVNYKDGRFHPKDLVIGVIVEKDAVAFPIKQMQGVGVVNEIIGGIPIVAIADPDLQTVRVFDRRVDGQTLTFTSDNGVIRDAELGRTWSREGRAESATSTELRLTRLESIPAFWFSWVAVHPDTRVIPES